MVKYTDEELMMFLDCYTGESRTLKSFKKYIVNDIYGIFYEVSNMPYEELPLYINDTDTWYRDCISIRLRIGR